MTYTKEEIECYTNILKNLNDGLNIYTPILDNLPRKKPEKASCKNCSNKHFFKDNGLLICNKCFCVITRCFINDYTSKDRCYFQKKSIYNRSYQEFILMIMLLPSNNSKKRNFLPKKHFIQNYSMKKFQMKIINMHIMYGILSIAELFKIIMIFI